MATSESIDSGTGSLWGAEGSSEGAELVALRARVAELEAELEVRRRRDEALEKTGCKVRGAGCLASVTCSSPMGTWEWDFPTGKVDGDRRFGEILGMDDAIRTRLDADLCADWVYPDDLTRFGARWQEHAVGEMQFFDAEVRVRQGGVGENWKWVHLRGQLLCRDPFGAPLKMVGTLSDIDARKQEERREAESRRSWETLFRFLPVPLLLWKLPDGACVDANEAFLRLAGKERSQVVGHEVRFFELWRDPEMVPRILERVARRGRLPHTDFEGRFADGLERQAAVSGVVFPLEGTDHLLTLFTAVGDALEADPISWVPLPESETFCSERREEG